MSFRRWLALPCMLLLGVLGCMSNQKIQLQAEFPRTNSRIHTQAGQRITGFTDIHGTYHKLSGVVRSLPGDSVGFYYESAPRTLTSEPLVMPPILMPRSEVQTIFVKQLNVPMTMLAVVGTVILVAAVLAAVVITSVSCPFIYSWDGQQYVFDGEPYGGAIMHSLERTDWSRLEHLIAVDGQYRLLLTNEVDETQHTNRIALRVLDHPEGSTVVMDRQGTPHAFRHLAPLVSASDELGNDLLVWLQANDHAAWYPDLRAHARQDSIADTRNHITLEFARPPGIARAFLVSNAATGQWGSHMIRTMLGMRGDRVQDFYAAINSSALYRQQLLEWNHREELFELFPEVRIGDAWVRQDFIPGGGPLISESRAIPVDLSGLTGDRVQIRLHPPIGFWSLNSFHLAWDEAEVTAMELSPQSSSGVGGEGAVKALASTDSAYLDFPNSGDRTDLVFKAPSERRGMARTIFAETRGWYEVHLHDLGPPDLAAIERLTVEPGFVVRRALREYAEFERTGVLQGVRFAPQPAGGR